MANRILSGTAIAAGVIFAMILDTSLVSGRSAQTSALFPQATTSAAEGTVPTSSPSFEVASIKKNVPDPSGRMFVAMGNASGDMSRWSATNVTARNLIQSAYGLNDYQLTGGPSWIGSEKFDVIAKVDDSMVPQLEKMTHQQQYEQMGLMVRSLLADRLKLQISRSTKDVPAFALVEAKGGSKLKEAPPPDAPNSGYSMNTGPSGATIRAVGWPLSSVSDLLSELLGRPVVDQTNLKGTYAFTLLYSQSDSPPENAPPSIFTALEQQLGLRIENTKAPIEIINVEHIEEPSEN